MGQSRSELVTARTNRLQPTTLGAGNWKHRFALIRPHITGADVLDIGAARGRANLHSAIADAANSVLAMDIDDQAVAMMQRDGMNAVRGDAEDFSLGQDFDVIFAGEIIEHLSNLSGFLTACKRHLRSDGVLILTTPNAFRLTNFVYRLRRPDGPVNPDHTLWLCETTMRQLMRKNGWEVTRIEYIKHDTPGRFRSRIQWLVARILPQHLLATNFLAEARPV